MQVSPGFNTGKTPICQKSHSITWDSKRMIFIVAPCIL